MVFLIQYYVLIQYVKGWLMRVFVTILQWLLCSAVELFINQRQYSWILFISIMLIVVDCSDVLLEKIVAGLHVHLYNLCMVAGILEII